MRWGISIYNYSMRLGPEEEVEAWVVDAFQELDVPEGFGVNLDPRLQQRILLDLFKGLLAVGVDAHLNGLVLLVSGTRQVDQQLVQQLLRVGFPLEETYIGFLLLGNLKDETRERLVASHYAYFEGLDHVVERAQLLLQLEEIVLEDALLHTHQSQPEKLSTRRGLSSTTFARILGSGRFGSGTGLVRGRW